MDAYFQSMLNTPTDRFSYTEPTSTFEAIFETGMFTVIRRSIGGLSGPVTDFRGELSPKGSVGLVLATLGGEFLCGGG